MTRLVHLVAHDVRAHGPLFAAWVAIVMAHPVVAAGRWSVDAMPFVWVLGVGLVAARLVLAVLLVATVVQADSPIDDHAFWRTRPIGPATMAAAKVTSTMAVFVLVPLCVVLGVAAVLRVPLWHLPSTVLGVLVGEISFVMLAMLVAARTRRTSNAVAGVVGVLVVLLLLAVAVDSAVPVARGGMHASPAILAGWAAFCLSALGGAAWWGDRTRTAVSVGAAAGSVVLVLLWIVPLVDDASSHAPTGQAAPRVTRLEVRRTAPGRVNLSAVVWHSGSASGNVLLDEVTIAIGDRTSRLSGPAPSSGPSTIPTERAFTVASLSDADAAALRGWPVQIATRIVSTAIHTTTEARAPLVAGTRLEGVHTHNTIEQVYRPTEEDPRVADVRTVILGERSGLMGRQGRVVPRLRDEATGSRFELNASAGTSDALLALVQLPILARPFRLRQLTLRARMDDLPDVDTAAAVLELEVQDSRISYTDSKVTLPMPGVTEGTRR